MGTQKVANLVSTVKEIALEYEESGNTEIAAMKIKAHEKMVLLSHNM